MLEKFKPEEITEETLQEDHDRRYKEIEVKLDGGSIYDARIVLNTIQEDGVMACQVVKEFLQHHFKTNWSEEDTVAIANAICDVSWPPALVQVVKNDEHEGVFGKRVIEVLLEAGDVDVFLDNFQKFDLSELDQSDREHWEKAHKKRVAKLG
ncbi:hypothetical protein KC865_03260 [Candidatus Kaiserbacteria bacterium]|nr:hypothetical protein [Candidatus Kaiserbacteria bacterium]USN92483.1 MAG: hypothetical protein H6782_01555 [Candidatus Nomurabacteria bacterium]